MGIDITRKQYDELNDNLIVDKNGKTNKKCPLCGNEIIVEEYGKSYSIKCRTNNCICLDYRGI